VVITHPFPSRAVNLCSYDPVIGSTSAIKLFPVLGTEYASFVAVRKGGGGAQGWDYKYGIGSALFAQKHCIGETGHACPGLTRYDGTAFAEHMMTDLEPRLSRLCLVYIPREDAIRLKISNRPVGIFSVFDNVMRVVKDTRAKVL